MRNLVFLVLIILIGCSGKAQRGISSLEMKKGTFFRDKDLSFNKKNEFKVEDGKIYHRKVGSDKWKILPAPIGSSKIVQIGVDSDQMVVATYIYVVTRQHFMGSRTFTHSDYR